MLFCVGGDSVSRDDVPTGVATRQAPSGNAPVFTARGLTKVYAMGEVTVHALRGVDFDLFSGEFVVLLTPTI